MAKSKLEKPTTKTMGKTQDTNLIASIATEWEDHPDRLPDVIQQVEAIAAKLQEWNGEEAVTREDLMLATIGYSRIVSSYECCEWLPFDLVPNWETDLYCWLTDEAAWNTARNNGDSISELAQMLHSKTGLCLQA
jgi:hypothetical protein